MNNTMMNNTMMNNVTVHDLIDSQGKTFQFQAMWLKKRLKRSRAGLKPQILTAKPRILTAMTLTAFAGIAFTSQPATRADTFTFTYSLGNYHSPSFTNSNGTYTIADVGNTNQTLMLESGKAKTLILDFESVGNFDKNNVNATAPGIFTGTSTSDMTFTLGGASLGTQTFSDGYTVDGTSQGAKVPAFTGAGSVLSFLVGNGEQIMVTPVAGNFREASLLLSPAGVTTPEPASYAAFAMGGFGLLGLGLKTRMMKARKRTA